MVLVVDDQREIRNVMVRLLRLDGFEAAAVESGMAALEFLRARVPHCMILDISMPEMDGFDVLRAIRGNPDWSRVHVIMYSAFDGELKDRAMRLGADAFIQKGTLDWSQMKKVLDGFCGHSKSPGRSEPPAESCDKDVG